MRPPTDQVMRECYAAMQVFRQLGFPSDNLYLAFGAIAAVGPFAGKRCVGVRLRWRDKEFNYTVAPVKNERRFASRWTNFLEHANALPPDDPELREIRRSSEAQLEAGLLVAALRSKGIEPPMDAN